MKSIDRLLRDARRLIDVSAEEENNLHVIHKGSCYACEGSCRYENKGNVLLEIDDCKVVVVKSKEKSTLANVPDDIIFKLADAASIESKRIKREMDKLEEHR